MIMDFVNGAPSALMVIGANFRELPTTLCDTDLELRIPLDELRACTHECSGVDRRSSGVDRGPRVQGEMIPLLHSSWCCPVEGPVLNCWRAA